MNPYDISFPVYKLREEEPSKTNGILYYIYKNHTEDEEDQLVLRVIDDTNVEGNTLSARRLVLIKEGHKLQKINKAFFFLGDLIKAANPHRWFIDSNGKCFKYTKNTRAKLVFRKVTKLFPIAQGGVLVEVQGIPFRMKALFAPDIPRDLLYAGVLQFGMEYILYGFYNTKPSDTWRKI